MIDYRQAQLPRHPPPAFQPDSRGQSVLLGQGQTKIENVLASTVGQSVPVKVGRGYPPRPTRLDLGLEFQLNLIQPCLREELRFAGGREQAAIAIEQRGNLLYRSQRRPGVRVEVTDECEMNPERNVRSFLQQLQRLASTGTGRHQAADLAIPFSIDCITALLTDGYIPKSSALMISTRASGE